MTSNQGFTIIGIAVGLTIFGLIAGAAVTRYETGRYRLKDNITQKRLDKIETAIGIFISRNARAPCVAARNAVINTLTYGREVACPATNSTFISGTEVIGGTGAGTNYVRIGAIPVRTLNLSDDHLYDGWGNLFTYAVTQRLANATPGGFYTATGASEEFGTITINDAVGDEQTNEAMYTITSHGPDGNGAFSPVGSQPTACVAANLDGENCNNTAPLTYTLPDDIDPPSPPPPIQVNYYSLSSTNSRYDDYIRYKEKTGIIFSVVKDYEFITLRCIGAQTAPPYGHAGLQPNSFSQNCSSLSFSSDDDRGYGINIASTGAAAGKNIYTTPAGGRIATTTGEVLIRVTIPIRYDNTLARVGPDFSLPNGLTGGMTPGGEYLSAAYKILPRDPDPKVILNTGGQLARGWESAIHGVIFAGNTPSPTTPIVIGDIINPVSFLPTSSILGTAIPPDYHEITGALGATGSIVVKYPITEGQPYYIDINIFSGSPPAIKNVSGWAGTIQLEDYHAEGYVEFMELGAI